MSARAETSESDLILVVADNCSDETASVSRNAGAICIERTNTELVGKGYALQYGIDYLKQAKEDFETVVVMDADCIFGEGSLKRLLNASQSKSCVAQALYLMKSPNKSNIKLNISEFTWLIKNWVRPLGQKKLGISCHLQGSGMAFPRAILNRYSLASSSIVEDLELGLNIVKGGDKVIFVPQAIVNSEFPENTEGLENQRKRWEHGHLSVVAKMPAVMFQGLKQFNARLFFQALDAAIPPTIIWSIFTVLMFVMAGIYGFYDDFFWAQFLGLCIITFVIGLILVWFKYGKAILPAKQLTGIIPFVLSKFSIYRTFISNREKSWVRTKRDEE
ncbi:glycosyltransferase family 2 protein [Alteromonas sp. A081]|uniref:glycosyltransferase family 2 protein n=1 Tax=Alteromonas sp. A081 TaxID=3410269 RepID=UPI003B97EB19